MPLWYICWISDSNFSCTTESPEIEGGEACSPQDCSGCPHGPLNITCLAGIHATDWFRARLNQVYTNQNQQTADHQRGANTYLALCCSFVRAGPKEGRGIIADLADVLRFQVIQNRCERLLQSKLRRWNSLFFFANPLRGYELRKSLAALTLRVYRDPRRSFQAACRFLPPVPRSCSGVIAQCTTHLPP